VRENTNTKQQQKRQRDNQLGWATWRNTQANVGPARLCQHSRSCSRTTGRVPAPKKRDGPWSLLSCLHGGGESWGWPEPTTSDQQAPPPRSSTIPCVGPISLVCRSHGARSGDLRQQISVTHSSEPPDDKPQPTPHTAWRAKSRCFGGKGAGAWEGWI